MIGINYKPATVETVFSYFNQAPELEYVDLNSTIGIWPPEARGCNAIDTVGHVLSRPVGSIYDKSLENSRCYSKEDIIFQDDQQPAAQSLPVAGMTIKGTEAKKPCGCGCQHSKKAMVAQGYTTENKRLFWLLTGLVALAIIVKIYRKK